MRVLFADAVGESTVTELEARGHTCVVDAGLKAADLPSSLDGFDALVVRSTKVGREVFENADRLALVIRAGAGTNTIDTGAAAARGVLVANLPGRNAVAVAELTMGLLLAVDRRIVDGTVDLRAGRWNKKAYGAARGLLGSTMGILGLGSIGLEVAQRARAFGMDVLALAKPDRSEHVRARAEDLHIGMAESLSELLPACDVVSLHLPSGPDTAGLVDRSFLGRMRPRVHPAEHLAGRPRRRGRAARGARRARTSAPGWTCTPTSPGPGRPSGPPGSPSTRGWSAPTTSGRRPSRPRTPSPPGVVEVIDAFVQGETPNCVNLTPSRIGSATLTVRHLDRVGVLAHVLDRLSRDRLNVEHMQNRVFRGGDAAVATIDVAGPLSDDLLADLGALPDVFGVSATTIDGTT